MIGFWSPRQGTALVLLAHFILEEIVMLFCSKIRAGTMIKAPVQADIRTINNSKIVLGGGFRLPVRAADNGTIRLGGGFRLPVRVA
jgi:hypothetical protein